MAFSDTIARGANWLLTIYDKQPDKTATDLTGCEAVLICRRTLVSEDVALLLDTGDTGGITITAEDGRIDIDADSTLTEAMEPGVYLVQLDMTWPSGHVDRLIDGTVTVTPRIPSAA